MSPANLLRKVAFHAAHRCLPLFWGVAALSLLGPWQVSLPSYGKVEALDGCQVLNVHDGDTMTVMCCAHADVPRKLKVRLYCGDVPELAQEPWGRQARDHLRGLVGAGTVELQVHDKNRYVRTVAEVIQGGRNLNLEMVRAGMVAVYPTYCRDRVYAQTERDTRSRGVGIWVHSGLHQRPWEWR